MRNNETQCPSRRQTRQARAWGKRAAIAAANATTGRCAAGGVAAALVSIPNRYMHSAVETVHLHDLDNAADLLAQFLTSLRSDDDFTP